MDYIGRIGADEKNIASERLRKGIQSSFISRYAFLLLIVLSLGVDFFTPFLNQQRILPSVVRYVADVAIMGMFMLLMVRTIVFDKIPKSLLIILGITLIWGIIPLFEQQSILATLWGWWRLFKYPIIGILTYLQPFWPENFSQKFKRGLLISLQLNTLLQIFQYANGAIPNDNLAGFFGRVGVAPLLMFITFCMSLAFAEWLVKHQWRFLLWVMILGGIASGLGEMKLFPVVVVVLSIITFLLQTLRGGNLQQLVFYTALIILIIFGFGSFYNTVVAEARGTLRIEEYLELETLDGYLNRYYVRDNGEYYIGRGYALQLGWETIQRDYTTLLFGMGLGSRSESTTLGVAGSGLLQSDFGIVAGSSLLVYMQEMGIVGLTFFAVFITIVCVELWRDFKRFPQSEHNSLRVGVIICSMTWPLLIYYGQTWTFSVFMTLYWGVLGYLLGYARRMDWASNQ